MMALVYHGTPMTPRSALLAQAGRAFCVSYFCPRDAADVEVIGSHVMYDNGAFSLWQRALRLGMDVRGPGDWSAYFDWLDARLWEPGRWAVIPDVPGQASQLNDTLLDEWPHGRSKGAPVWHMDGPIRRLGRLCERFDRVCLGWVGDGPAERAVGCGAYRRRMDEVASLFGNSWHPLHMLRGVAVGGDYPFHSADSTSLAQNGHRYDSPMDELFGDPWRGRTAYAQRLERMAA
ncbi:hypothetical protein ABIC17_001811 [Sphingomonas sp. PvP056]